MGLTKRPDIDAKLHPQRDREQVRQEVERMLNFRLLGIPPDRSQPYKPNPNPPAAANANTDFDEHTDPAILI